MRDFRGGVLGRFCCAGVRHERGFRGGWRVSWSGGACPGWACFPPLRASVGSGRPCSFHSKFLPAKKRNSLRHNIGSPARQKNPNPPRPDIRSPRQQKNHISPLQKPKSSPTENSKSPPQKIDIPPIKNPPPQANNSKSPPAQNSKPRPAKNPLKPPGPVVCPLGGSWVLKRVAAFLGGPITPPPIGRAFILGRPIGRAFAHRRSKGQPMGAGRNQGAAKGRCAK